MPTSTEDAHKLLRAWQLALLRFAVTLDAADRLNVAAIAAELDRLGGRRNAGDTLHFFRRTSSRLCAAIGADPQDADATLERFCKQIEEPRLRLAFAAAVGLAQANSASSQAARPKRPSNLFRGLPARGSASL